MALFRSFATVSGLTGVSRVLGFIRDVLIAAVLGAGPVADAFFVAFRLPNLFRRLFAEGAFNAAFVPLFARELEAKGPVEAKRFAEDVLAVMLAALLLLTAAAMAGMPWLLYLLAPGFSETPEKYRLTVELTRICFPYLLFISLTALLSGLLNSLYRFAAAAAAPILLNVFFIGALVVLIPMPAFREGEAPGFVLAWTVAAAGLAQFLYLMVAAKRAGMALRLPRPRLTPKVKRLLQLMGPGVLSGGALQINVLVTTIIASLEASAVSYLYYADRLYQLPLGLIGIGIGVVLLPDISRKLRAGDVALANNAFNRALELSLFFVLPAAVALFIIPLPVVSTLFERGAFGAEASAMTALAVRAYALGLPGFVLVKVLQPSFYAREDTMLPFKAAFASVVVNIALSLLLFFQVGFVGLAVAQAAAAWVNVAILWAVLRRRGYEGLDARSLARLPRSLIAAVLMGLVLVAAERALSGWFAGGEAERITGLALLVGAGLAAFAAAALVTGAFKKSDLGLLRRGRGAGPS